MPGQQGEGGSWRARRAASKGGGSKKRCSVDQKSVDEPNLVYEWLYDNSQLRMEAMQKPHSLCKPLQNHLKIPFLGVGNNKITEYGDPF